MIQAHMFWAYGNLSKLELICVRSFVQQGYKLNLWSYGEVTNLPSGVRLRDARDILSEDKVFRNKFNSFASFADVFRYALLSKVGGLWSDTDVAAATPAADLPTEKFFVSQWLLSELQLNNNIIFNPNPAKSDLIDMALCYSLNFKHENVRWSELGPDLLTAIASIFPEHGFRIMPPGFANPIRSVDCPAKLLEPSFEFDTQPTFIHLFNEMWRRTGTAKEQKYPAGSCMDLLFRGQAVRLKKSASPDFTSHAVVRKAEVFFEGRADSLGRRR